MIQAIRNTLAFRGRLTRLGYWRWQLALLLLVVGFAYAAIAVTIAGGPRWLAALVFAPIAIVAIGAVGVVARRLHDRGRGVLWLVVFTVAPWGLAGLSIWLTEGHVAADQTWLGPASLVAGLLSLLLNVWGFVEIGLLRGHPVPNRFGPPA